MARKMAAWLVMLIVCGSLTLAQTTTSTTAPVTSEAPPPNVTAVPLSRELAAHILQPGDMIRLLCWNASGLLVNSILSVGTDGSMRPPGITPVSAAHTTLADLQTRLITAYSTVYTGATLLVMLEDARAPALPDLSTLPPLTTPAPPEVTEPLRTEQQLAIRCWAGETEYLNVTVRVSRDLTIALPPLGPVTVRDETLVSLRDKLQARYRAYYPRCSLSVLLADGTAPAPAPPVTEEPEIPVTEIFPPTMTAGEILRALPRFGLRMFGVEGEQPLVVPPGAPAANVPVPADYLVGPGDSLSVRSWTGAVEHLAIEVIVSPEGRIYVPQLGDMAVAGQTLAQVTSLVAGRTGRLYRDAQTTVVLSQIRTVDVYVTGDAVTPGRYTLPGTATVFTALYAAGGPAPSGSLREIRVVRRDQAAKTVDLYPYLLTGERAGDDPLQPGDTVFIGPLGETIGVSGLVRRAGLYELREQVTAAEALRMAGGIDPRGYSRNVEVWRVDQNTAWNVVNVDLSLPADDVKGPAFPLRGGDLLLVRPVLDRPANTVNVAGAVRRPGDYEVPAGGLDVRGLLQRAEGPDDIAYMRSAAIWRLTPDNSQRLLRVDLLKAQQGEPTDNLPLVPGDKLYVYSREEVMQSQDVAIGGAVASPGVFPWAEDMRVSDLLLLGRGPLDGAHVGRADLRRLTPQFTRELIAIDLAQVLAGEAAADLALRPGDQLTVYQQTEMGVAAEVIVLGAVLRAGVYSRATGMKASDLIQQAGGLLPEAGTEATLVKGRVTGAAQTVTLALSYDDAGRLVLNPDPELADDDSLTIGATGGFRTRADVVVLEGQVIKPGTYPLLGTPDEPDTVYKLLDRAGGLLPQGNPRGIIIYRQRDALMDPDQTDDLNQVLTGFNRERTPGGVSMTPEARTATLQATVSNQLASVFSGQNGMAIVVPPRILSAESWARAVPIDGQRLLDTQGAEGDMPLMPGDTVVVPTTPTTVALVGAVVRPGAVSYDGPKKTAWDYVTAAGGPAPDAAIRRLVVVRANGSVSPTQDTKEIYPGDVIVVPSSATVRNINPESGTSRFMRTLAAAALAFLIF